MVSEFDLLLTVLLVKFLSDAHFFFSPGFVYSKFSFSKEILFAETKLLQRLIVVGFIHIFLKILERFIIDLELRLDRCNFSQ